MTASSPHHRQDPAPEIPDSLFADDAVENRWRGRFTAARVSVPDWARDGRNMRHIRHSRPGSV